NTEEKMEESEISGFSDNRVEIKAPLTVVSGSLEMIEETKPRNQASNEEDKVLTDTEAGSLEMTEEMKSCDETSNEHEKILSDTEAGSLEMTEEIKSCDETSKEQDKVFSDTKAGSEMAEELKSCDETRNEEDKVLSDTEAGSEMAEEIKSCDETSNEEDKVLSDTEAGSEMAEEIKSCDETSNEEDKVLSDTEAGSEMAEEIKSCDETSNEEDKVLSDTEAAEVETDFHIESEMKDLTEAKKNPSHVSENDELRMLSDTKTNKVREEFSKENEMRDIPKAVKSSSDVIKNREAKVLSDAEATTANVEAGFNKENEIKDIETEKKSCNVIEDNEDKAPSDAETTKVEGDCDGVNEHKDIAEANQKLSEVIENNRHTIASNEQQADDDIHRESDTDKEHNENEKVKMNNEPDCPSSQDYELIAGHYYYTDHTSGQRYKFDAIAGEWVVNNGEKDNENKDARKTTTDSEGRTYYYAENMYLCKDSHGNVFYLNDNQEWKSWSERPSPNANSSEEQNISKWYFYQGDSMFYRDNVSNIVYKLNKESNAWEVYEGKLKRKRPRIDEEEEFDTDEDSDEEFGNELQPPGARSDPNITYDGVTYTKLDPSDKMMYEWDANRRAWFPKVDEDFMATYQLSYGFNPDGTKNLNPLKFDDEAEEAAARLDEEEENKKAKAKAN
ncbi:hypothetical protein OTU49_003977, partial [Cherax quadricarinatus]